MSSERRTIKLGLGLPHAGPLASRENILRTAMSAESIGLDSVWVLDRVLRPLAPDWGSSPPPFYSTVFDPIETLSYVAAHTTRIELGTSAIQALLHPPVILAKRLATVDALSGGRVIAGLAQGWMPEEFSIAGVPLSRRGEGMIEFVDVLRAVWAPDPVRYEGRIYRVPESDIGPKPARPIPVLLGYDSDAGVRLAARCADGLHPNRHDLHSVKHDLELFREAAATAGRDPDVMPIVFRGAVQSEPDAEVVRPLFSGTVDRWAEDILALGEIGIDHVFLQLHTEVEEQVDTMQQLRSLI